MREAGFTTVILGGGSLPDGTFTRLSRQRLDEGVRLYQNGDAPQLTVLGQRKRADDAKAGADLRAEYLMAAGVEDDAIVRIIGGGDTIGEALACRAFLPAPVRRIRLVTSDIHVPRALWIFETVLGADYHIEPHGVPCDGILLPEEELAYLHATQDYFAQRPSILDMVDDWHNRHAELYRMFKGIHDRFHPAGKESEAYGSHHPLNRVKQDS